MNDFILWVKKMPKNKTTIENRALARTHTHTHTIHALLFTYKENI